MGAGLRPRAKAMDEPPDPTVRAPVLDPTGGGEMEKVLPPVDRHCRSKRTPKRNPAPAKNLASSLPYSNYDALVEALHKGQVEVAWNTPLAHAQYHRRAGNASKTLVMRDVDCNVRSKLILRKDVGIASPSALAGKTLILGSRDAAEATVLPIHFLKREGLDLGKVKVLSLDKEVDLRGNPCSSEVHVLKALLEGRGQAGIIGER